MRPFDREEKGLRSTAGCRHPEVTAMTTHLINRGAFRNVKAPRCQNATAGHTERLP
jgi:hypothetical protein